ncbi:peptidase S10, partial [Ralstonia pickettii]|nr:peptidase S10 [Ralstonia pickettii]
SPLAADGDPSSSFITKPFTDTIGQYLPNELKYTAQSAYSLSSNAINTWDWTHDGLAMPDTIPDLLGALQLNPKLRVLAENGFHDLATPFFNTEKQLARLQTVKGLNPKLQVNFFQGGHMIYLDDVARPQMKRDLKTFYKGARIPTALTLHTLPPPWPDENPPSVPTGSVPGATAATTLAAAP